jgi:hypothetical protein
MEKEPELISHLINPSDPIFEFADTDKWCDTRLIERYDQLNDLLAIPRTPEDRIAKEWELLNILLEAKWRIYRDLNQNIKDESF